MRTLRGPILAVIVGLGVAGSGSVLAIGCGGGTSAQPAHDAGNDVTADTGPDVHVVEAGDAGDAGDSSDSGNVVVDSGDATPPAFVFAQTEAKTLCTAFLDCCPGGLDSGTYSLSQCIAGANGYGWEGTLPSDTNIYSRGNVTFDSAKAASCLTAIKAFPCGTQTAAQWSAITQACELVIQGTIASGQGGCASSWECAANTFCDPTVDGGLCRPLATQGEPCDTLINTGTGVQENPIPDEMCSYLGSGAPALFCDLINNGGNAPTCQPLVASGGNCINATTGYYDDQACVTSAALCGDNSQCGGTASYPYPSFCTNYAITDAGGGG